MIKRVFLSLSVVVLLSGFPSYQVSANTSFKPDLIPRLSFGDNFTLARPDMFSTKSGIAYDESKDPALRKGTENWEEPQGSYFAIPALIVGVIGLVLFFNRDK